MKIIIAILLSLSSLQAVTNIVGITEKSGSTQSNYPVSIFRVFKQGEFLGASYPKAAICTDSTCASTSGTIATQVDVASRWGDASIKSAYLNWIIPTLTGAATNYYTFSSQAVCNCGVDLALTRAQVLSTSAPNYDFDASIKTTNRYLAQTKTFSARTALTNWPQCTLNGALTNAATSIPCTVTNGTFPAAPFDLWITDSHTTQPWGMEKVRVTAVAGSPPNLTFTAVRGFDGTTAISHNTTDLSFHAKITYLVAGPIATRLIFFDPVSKMDDYGWQPANIATWSAGSGMNLTLAVPFTAIVSSTTGWTNGITLHLQQTDASFNPTLAITDFVKANVTDGTHISVTSKSSYPANISCSANVAVTSAAGKIYPDQWSDPGAGSIYDSLRPYIDATVFPGLSKYHVNRWAIENADTERAQDQHYDLTFTYANTSPITGYSQTDVWQAFGQVATTSYFNNLDASNSWTFVEGSETIQIGKEWWDGDPAVTPFPVGPTHIDHGAVYIESTNALPNFNLAQNSMASGGTYEALLKKNWDDNTNVPGVPSSFPGSWYPKNITGTIDSNPATTTMTVAGSFDSHQNTQSYVPMFITIDSEDMIIRNAPVTGGAATWTVEYRGVNGTAVSAHSSAAIKLNHRIGDKWPYDGKMGQGGKADYSNVNTVWSTTYLRSFDERLRIKTIEAAERAGYFPSTIREGVNTKRLVRSDCGGVTCAAGAGTGLGHFVSTADRVTLSSLGLYAFYSAAAGDKIVPVAVTSTQWQPSNFSGGYCVSNGFNWGYNHLPDSFSIIYAVTGDPYYLNEMQSIASWSGAYTPPNSVPATTGRGPTGAYYSIPFLSNNMNGNNVNVAWFVREAGRTMFYRAAAAFFSRDKTGERNFYAEVLNDGLASMEGAHNLTTGSSYGSSFQGDPTYGTVWTWAKTNQYDTQLGTKIDQMVNLYEAESDANTWNGSEMQNYGVDALARSQYQGAPGGVIAGGTWLPTHASGASLFNSSAYPQAPTGSPLTTTTSCIDTVETASAATLNAGKWQFTVPTALTNCLAVGSLLEIRCSTGTVGAPCQFSGLGRHTVTAVASGLVTIDTGGGDTYSANTAWLVQMSFGVASCAWFSVAQQVFVTAELWYIDTCSANQASASGGTAGYMTQVFGNSYVEYALGRANEMGFTQALPMLRWMSTLYANGLTDVNMNPVLFKMMYFPNVKAADMITGISSWADVKAGAIPGIRNDTTAKLELGVAYRAMEYSFGASSYIPAGWTNGAAAQSWMDTNVKAGITPTAGQDMLKWDILPRVTPVCTITINTCPNATTGVAYTCTVATIGCASPTFSVVGGSGLPAWASLNTGSGAITGTPSGGTPTTSTFGITVTDANGNPTQTLSITDCIVPVITTASLPNATQGTPYSQQLAATGDNSGNCTGCAWAASGLPVGLTFSTGGLISGTPTSITNSTIIATATNACGTSTAVSLSLNIIPAPASSCPTGIACVIGNTTFKGTVK